MTLTKAELAQRLVDEVGLNQREAKEMVELFFSEIAEALIIGEDCQTGKFWRISDPS